jgi:hypothetical protein
MKSFFTLVGSSTRRIASHAAALLTTLALLLATLSAGTPAQAHQVSDLVTIGGDNNDVGNSIAIDAAGNRYITGAFQSRANFSIGGERVALATRGADDAFVARVNADGRPAWTQQIGGALVDIGHGLALGARDTLYVTGRFNARATFPGGITRTSRGQGDAFLIQFDRNGALRWLVQIGGSTDDAGFSVAPLGDDVIVVGLFSGTATFPQADGSAVTTLSSAGANDIFVARYNGAGELVWARQAGGPDNDAARSVAVDSAGAIYLTGSFSATAAFSSPGAAQQLTSAGRADIFVASYGPNGDLRRVTSAGGAQNDVGLGIALDAAGNGYLTGSFTAQATFGQQALSGAGVQIVLARLDQHGQFQQAVQAGGAGTDEGRGIAVAPNGTIYLTGRYQDAAQFGAGANIRELRQRDRSSFTNSGVFTAAYNPALQPIFLEGAGGEATLVQSGNAVASDTASNAHVTGVVQRRATFGVGSAIQGEATRGPGDAFLVTYATGTPREVFYVSSTSGGSIDGIGFADEDVLAYDPANNRWAALIDGSDIGLAGTDIDAFEWVNPTTLLMSFDTPVTLSGIAERVEPADIVRFTPQRLGPTTRGRFELFFDGSDVGLDEASENVDALALDGDGRLLISTSGVARVPGPNGAVISAGDADVLLFASESLGESTQGEWQVFFRGAPSLIGDNPGEGLRALWFPPDGGFVLSTGGDFVLSEALPRPFGDGAEAFRCDLFELDGVQTCAPFPFLDGAAKGLLGESIDAFSVGASGVMGEIGEGDDTEPGPDEDPPAAPDAARIFLPLLRMADA